MVFSHKRFVISMIASKDGCISLLSQEYLTQTFTLLDCSQSLYLPTGNKKWAKWAQSTRGGEGPIPYVVKSSVLQWRPVFGSVRAFSHRKYILRLQHKFSRAHCLICMVNKRTDTWRVPIFGSFEVISALPSSRRRPARCSSVQHFKPSHRFFKLLFPFQRILRRISLSQVYDCKK